MGFYEILVAGEIEKFREFYLDDMKTEKLKNGTTSVKGFLPDSSAMYGVINKMRDMGLEILKLEKI